MTSDQPFRVDAVLDACRERGLSQNQLAKQLGVNRATISHWLRGPVPEPRRIVELASLLDVPFESIYCVPESERGLSYYRIRRGLKGTDVARAIGVPVNSIYYFESGQARPQSPKSRSVIAKVDTHAWAALIGLTKAEFDRALEVTNRLHSAENKHEASDLEIIIA